MKDLLYTYFILISNLFFHSTYITEDDAQNESYAYYFELGWLCIMATYSEDIGLFKSCEIWFRSSAWGHVLLASDNYGSSR